MSNHHRNNTFARPSTVMSGARAYQALADAWGIDVDDLYTDDYREARDDLKAWGTLTVNAAPPNVHDIVLNNDRDTWHTAIKKRSAEAVAAQLITDAHPHTEATLRNRRDAELTNDAAWAHVATVLDVDAAVADFNEAVQALGTAVLDPMKAAQKNPNAFATYMRRAPQLLYLDALGPRWKDAATMHSTVPNLPTLTYSKDGLGKITKHYDEAMLNRHRVARKLAEDAREDHFITALALGEYPDFELGTTLDPDVYRQRQGQMSGAGHSEQVE